ncbi:restriction endonuclease subunit S [Brachybacterium tyrofermentans]|uniref:restriction endonuclease subunit S n=1 Tax=Brachybacterium tyrofermentans TaxID=47848 RepID=UPI003FCF3A61
MAVKEETVGAQSGDFDLLSLTKAGVIYRDISTGKGKIPASFDTYQVIEEGDLIMCLFDVDETPRTVGRARQHGMITGAYDRFVVKNDVLAEYVNWFYLSVDNTKGLRPLYRGLRKTVPVDQFMASQLPVPPAEEQAAIVKYLAHANARIDKAIAAKRHLIALLEEQYTAQVVGVFARHESDAAPLLPLKRLVNVKGGMTPSKENQAFWGGDIPWVSPKDVKANVLLDSIDHITQEAFDQTNISLVPRGAVVVVVRGMILARTVPVATLGVMSTLNQDMKALVPHGEMLSSEYLRDWLRTHEAEVIQLVETAGHGTKKLDTDRLMNLRLPVPALAVQEQLSARVDAEGAATRTTVMRIRAEITLLQEFRTRLVADVVTGQVDVRAIAATLPDAPESFDSTVSATDDDLEEALSEGEE